MNQLSGKTLLIWLILALIPITATVHAAERSLAGRVVFLNGGAFASDTRGSRNLTDGATLFTGDIVVTGHGARLAFELRDQTVISLGANTVFQVESYRFDGPQKPGVATLRLLKGAFRAASGLIGQFSPQNFTVHTPVATIGIRGTEFWGGFEFSDALDVALLGGKGIYVENKAGRVEISQPGEGTTVQNAGTAPSPPKSWPADKVQRAQAATAW